MTIKKKLIIESGNKKYQENFRSDLDAILGKVALTNIINRTKMKLLINSQIACSK